MKRLLFLLALLAIPAATTGAPVKPPVIRALFVGIDEYLYSKPTNPYADFRNLKGAVGDVVRIKAALRTAYRLDLDQPGPGCVSQNAVSITLTDTCAKRAAILESLQRQIDASSAGDTLIFYYAGHGSQIADDQVGDQASGMNDTILPTDARKPGAETDGDILDRELRGYVDEATVKGVNVVTIFDSCDSGSGVRGGPIANDPGEDRAAPPLLAKKKLERPAPPIARGPGGGYRVHLAAAADGQVAREAALGEGQRAGIFTSALAKTLVAMPNATFGDIMAEVSLRVEESGHPGQIPQVEGAITATMRGGDSAVALFDASPRDGSVMLAAGQLSGMTPGSTFALFATASDALTAGGTPLATGAITAVGATMATVTLDVAPATALPQRLIAREISHAYGATTLAVRNGGENGKEKRTIARALAGLSFVRVTEPAAFAVDVTWDKKSTAYLSSIDGASMLKIGSIKAPDFADKLRATLQKVMRAQAILALRTGGGSAVPGFCIDNDMDYDSRRCPQLPQGKPFVVKVDAKAKLTVTNTADTPRHLYVYAINEEFDVNLLLPTGGGKDPPLLAGMSVNATVQPDQWGRRYRFVTISTAADAPIGSARTLEQSGTRAPGACVSALERLICEAASGTRDPGVPRVGAWVATVTDVVVK